MTTTSVGAGWSRPSGVAADADARASEAARKARMRAMYGRPRPASNLPPGRAGRYHRAPPTPPMSGSRPSPFVANLADNIVLRVVLYYAALVAGGVYLWP